MPDRADRVNELQKDVKNTDMNELRQDLAAIRMSVTPEEFRGILDDFNKGAPDLGLPAFTIVDSNNDGVVDKLSIDTSGASDGNLFGGVDVYNGDNMKAIEDYNTTFSKDHPSLANDLKTLEALGMVPVDNQKFREAWNFYKAHHTNEEMGTLINSYNEVANNSGGVLQKIYVQNLDDGSPHIVTLDGDPLPQDALVVYPQNTGEQVLFTAAEIGGTLAGALQVGVATPFEDADS